jgi:hypothetical protein
MPPFPSMARRVVNGTELLCNLHDLEEHLEEWSHRVTGQKSCIWTPKSMQENMVLISEMARTQSWFVSSVV